MNLNLRTKGLTDLNLRPPTTEGGLQQYGLENTSYHASINN